MTKCPARSFHNKAPEHIPEALRPALEPVFLEQIASLSERIRQYDRLLVAISKEHYPETELLRQVEGIGPLRALTFVLTLEDPYRASKGAARWGRTWGSFQPQSGRERGILVRSASARRATRC